MSGDLVDRLRALGRPKEPTTDVAAIRLGQERLIAKIEVLTASLDRAENRQMLRDARLDTLPRELVDELRAELKAATVTWALAAWGATRARIFDYGWKLLLTALAAKIAYWTHTTWGAWKP